MKLTPMIERPEIVALDNKIAALTTRKANLETRLQDAIEQARETDSDGVDKLLKDPAASLAKRDDPEELKRELDQIQEATNRLQQERTSNIGRLSRQVCDEYAPEHRKRVQRILQAGRELAAANAAVVQLFDEVERQGYSAGSLRMMQFLDPGSPSDRESLLRIFERECAEFGFLDRKSLLSEVRGLVQ